jgi:hypothetical protein
VLVGRKPRQRPRNLLIDERPRLWRQAVVLVERQADVLALGTALNARPVLLAREAKALGDVYGLVKRGQRGVLEPGV